MRPREKILTYLLVYGKAHKYKIARQLKIDVSQVTKVLSKLRDEGKIEIKNGNAILKKGKKLVITKAKKRNKQPKEEPEESKKELSGESAKEEQPTEISEETQLKKNGKHLGKSLKEKLKKGLKGQ